MKAEYLCQLSVSEFQTLKWVGSRGTVSGEVVNGDGERQRRDHVVSQEGWRTSQCNRD